MQSLIESPLLFNREKARNLYIKKYPVLSKNPRRLELILWRGTLLTKNPLFVKEWLAAYEAIAGSNWQEKQSYRKAFLERWGVDLDNGLLEQRSVKGVSVQIVDAERREASVTVKIDLRYSQEKIHEAFAAILKDWHEKFREELELDNEILADGYFPHWFNAGDEEAKRFQPIEVLEGKERKDLLDYETNMKVWELKEEHGLSWSQISKQMRIPTETARGKMRSAKKMIREGMPGFPPFPTTE